MTNVSKTPGKFICGGYCKAPRCRFYLKFKYDEERGFYACSEYIKEHNHKFMETRENITI